MGCAIGNITIDLIRAGELIGYDGEAEHLKDANGVSPRFGRCWWYWLPYFRYASGPKYIPALDFGWLCWLVSIMFWPKGANMGCKGKGKGKLKG